MMSLEAAQPISNTSPAARHDRWVLFMVSSVRKASSLTVRNRAVRRIFGAEVAIRRDSYCLRPVVFSLDPGPLHRPLGVVFGAERGGGLAWLGVERAGAETFVLLPPAENANAAASLARERLARSSGVAAEPGGIVFARGELDEAQVRALADAAADAGERPRSRVLVLARRAARATDRASSTEVAAVAQLVASADAARAGDFARWLAAPREPALASARGVVDGLRVSVLGIAAGRPLPGRDEGMAALLLTDATFAPGMVAPFAAELAERSFGQVAGVRASDRDDAIVVVATSAAGTTPLTNDSIGGRTLLVGAVAVAQALVQQLLEKSGPSAAPVLVVQITVSGALDGEQAAAVAEAIAVERPAPEALADAVARIAAGAGVRVDRSKLHADWKRNAARAALRVDLGLAHASATRWTAFA
jgi:hypothetical protein